MGGVAFARGRDIGVHTVSAIGQRALAEKRKRESSNGGEKLNMKPMFRIIRQTLLWIALFRLIVLSQASAQDKVRGTPMEHVDLRHASIEKIHQVAEKDANLAWSLMHLPDPITHKVSTITHKDVEEKAATFRVYARLHHLEGDDAAAYVDWALDRLDKLRPKEHH
jgi:hypothetical protein